MNTIGLFLRFILCWLFTGAMSFFCFICIYATEEGTDSGFFLWKIGVWLSYVFLGPLRLGHLFFNSYKDYISFEWSMILNTSLMALLMYGLWLIKLKQAKTKDH